MSRERGDLVETKYGVPLYGSRFLKFVQRNRLDDAEEIWFRLEPCDGSASVRDAEVGRSVAPGFRPRHPAIEPFLRHLESDCGARAS